MKNRCSLSISKTLFTAIMLKYVPICSYWRLVDIGSFNGLAPSQKRPLCEQMLSQITLNYYTILQKVNGHQANFYTKFHLFLPNAGVNYLTRKTNDINWYLRNCLCTPLAVIFDKMSRVLRTCPRVGQGLITTEISYIRGNHATKGWWAYNPKLVNNVSILLQISPSDQVTCHDSGAVVVCAQLQLDLII